jgi:hypothetical protein
MKMNIITLLLVNMLHMKTYTIDEAMEMTGKFIDEQAEVLRQNLRNKKNIHANKSEYI